MSGIVVIGAGQAAGQAAASLRQEGYEGDIVIMCSYAEVEADEAALHQPVVIFVDEKNDPKPAPLEAKA